MCLPYSVDLRKLLPHSLWVGDESRTAFFGRSCSCPSNQHRNRGADLLRITALGRARDLGTKKSGLGVLAYRRRNDARPYAWLEKPSGDGVPRRDRTLHCAQLDWRHESGIYLKFTDSGAGLFA